MSKKDENDALDDYGKLENEIIIDRVNEVFRREPDNYIAALEELGFEYHEDEDEMEEKAAKPENDNQRDLVAYFEGEGDATDAVLAIFLAERDAERPNLPLIRKYFKKANQRLKALLLYGLNHYPAMIDLLSDLAYFHEFENILSTLITYYTRACVNEMNLVTFAELAQDFHYATSPDGYDALVALRELLEAQTEKRRIIDSLITEEAEAEKLVKPHELH